MNGASSGAGKAHHRHFVNVTHSPSSTVVPTAQTASRLTESSPLRWSKRNGHVHVTEDAAADSPYKEHRRGTPQSHYSETLGDRADDVYGTVVDIRDLFHSTKREGTPGLEYSDLEQRSRPALNGGSAAATASSLDHRPMSSPHTQGSDTFYKGHGGGNLRKWESAPEDGENGDTRVGSFVSGGRVSDGRDSLSLSADSFSVRNQRQLRRKWRQSRRKGGKNARDSWILRSLEFEQFLTTYINELEYQENAFQRRYTTGAGCGRHSRRRHLERYVRRAASAIKDANRLQEVLENSEVPGRDQRTVSHKPVRAKSVPPRKPTPQRLKNPQELSPSTTVGNNQSQSSPAKGGSYSMVHARYRRPHTVEVPSRTEFSNGLPFGKLPIELSIEEYLEWEAQHQEQGKSTANAFPERDTSQKASIERRTGPVDALEGTVPDIFWKSDKGVTEDDDDTGLHATEAPNSAGVLAGRAAEVEDSDSKLNAVSAASTLIENERSLSVPQLQVDSRVMSHSLCPAEDAPEAATANFPERHVHVAQERSSDTSSTRRRCFRSMFKCWHAKQR
eukprot:gb/GECG01015598.1/.p1 GENE.gb/GECG01015598.1/~~gb/GECG01015598.1/.p1  ORF type:complete len:561 (+),score=62.08 gb/GECG01015598.1/:1-1683(+)